MNTTTIDAINNGPRPRAASPFFLTKFLEKNIDETKVESILDDLLRVNATTPEREMQMLKITRKK
ncbi:MAG TPA: hypothetical protein VKM55_17225 [Candidatus Lokiarchaeia archaeon]|nr:hypothetical protein [Candidatus Lokiarchaeia archaeon]